MCSVQTWLRLRDFIIIIIIIIIIIFIEGAQLAKAVFSGALILTSFSEVEEDKIAEITDSAVPANTKRQTNSSVSVST